MMLLSCMFVLFYTFLSRNVQALEENCGNQGTFNKILGGTLTELDEFPWLARLEYLDSSNESAGFACTGALVNARVVITAAHCITFMESKKLYLFRVRLGEYNTTSEVDCVENLGIADCTDGHKDISVESHKIHPEFLNGYSDIALLFLKEKVNYTEFIRPLCLPKDPIRTDAGDKFTISGWGRTEHDTNSTVKLKVSLPVYDFWKCFWKYADEGILLNKHRHLCVGGITGRDSCTGDSGAPLMTSRGRDGKWKIVGITSIGKWCGLKDWPGIYSRVDFYTNWIRDEVNIFLNNNKGTSK